MSGFKNDVYEILSKAESNGALGSSATMNAILESAKANYKNTSDEGKKAIIEKLEQLAKTQGMQLPTNYLQIIS
ncbi:hypothetical protein [Moellerella wisconsensis]|uniref:Uncharacterized protein n=1 Tax=Moellerella wisconsensis TaxID=158849 RepID=A0A9Q8Q130_9GAMM|nr:MULTISPECIES: hypothetical protein [Morganellaceae]QPE18777.1 hypothetical protein IMQ36_06605 [Providencia rettgeri]UNH30076.1 hypothetical protein MNY72_12075 [Moellerella wisconsensis]